MSRVVGDVAVKVEMEQGSQEWLSLRKTKITATDASVIMGVNPWKTPLQLYHEKMSTTVPTCNERMQRGLELEPLARDLFCLKTGINVEPCVVMRDWMMASLDGLCLDPECMVEIKCPGERDHAIALSGNVPDHYYPQLQHQMAVTGLNMCYYFSFDGIDGVVVNVFRNEEYISKMVEAEKKFYDCIINKTPPEPTESDYIDRNDKEWNECASKWQMVSQAIKDLESQEEDLRNQLIILSNGWNAKGAGISLCQVKRKGNVDYSKIEALNGIDLEQYRKPSSTSWRITCQ